MKETGMIRRLDDLGRLVIPKEIRKMYKMKEGDSIEIFIQDGNIMIRKYDETSSFYEQIEMMCEILMKKYNTTILFNSMEYLKRHKLEIEDTIIHKTQVHRATRFENYKIYKNSDQRYSGYICPVVKDGNYYGSFVMVFEKYNYSIEELESLQLFCDLLTSQQH